MEVVKKERGRIFRSSENGSEDIRKAALKLMAEHGGTLSVKEAESLKAKCISLLGSPKSTECDAGKNILEFLLGKVVSRETASKLFNVFMNSAEESQKLLSTEFVTAIHSNSLHGTFLNEF